MFQATVFGLSKKEKNDGDNFVAIGTTKDEAVKTAKRLAARSGYTPRGFSVIEMTEEAVKRN